MCMICNMPDRKSADDASAFLAEFIKASASMDRAAKLMKKCHSHSKHKPYDTVHKKMVKLIKDWNRLEHQRE